MKKRKFKPLKVIIFSIIALCAFVLMFLGAAFVYAQRNVDYSRDEMLFSSEQFSGASMLYYYGEDGKAYEYCIVSPSDNRSLWYSYSDIPEVLKAAFISAEDRRFFDHRGIDVKRTAYAVINYILKLRPEFGGSTITQQVIKNISGDNEHSVARKLNEILRAVHIEDLYSKEEIFEVYLNIVPMGNGISGVGLASEYYFGKEPSMLTPDEAAVLVGITNAPSRYDPRENYSASVEKRNRVLYAMLDNGVITRSEYEEYSSRDICLSEQKKDIFKIDNWFSETVVGDVVKDLSSKMNISQNAARILLLNGGYSIYTTVDPKIQSTLEDYFYDESNFPTELSAGLDYSMIVTDSDNGYVRAIVGAAGDKKANRINNGALLPHTPGSTLKPLALYAPYIESGDGCWSTVFDDVPFSFVRNSAGELTDYPKNSPARYDGRITLADALMLSKNSVAARLYSELGEDRIYDSLVNNYGFALCDRKKTEQGVLTDKALSPLALGQLTYGLSLRELTGAYSTFIGYGIYREPISYTKVVDPRGKTVLENKQETKRVISRETSEIMNMMLSRVVEYGTASSVTLNELYDTAGKTGTSGGDKDRLFIGYTPYFVCGIHCGYNSDKAVGRVGKSHLTIWDEVMHNVHSAALENREITKSFKISGLKYLPYCKDSGELFSDNCLYDRRGSRLDYGYFSSELIPSVTCCVHVVTVEVDDNGNERRVSLLDIPKREFPIETEIADDDYIFEKTSTSGDANKFITEVNNIRFDDRYEKKKIKNKR